MGKTKGFFKEFREFASRGNVMDMAVGVIVGGAFKAIVDSLVKDIIMPFIGIFIDASSFSDWALKIGNAEILIGQFIAAVLNFLIVALIIFCLIKLINRAHAIMEFRRKAAEIQEEAAEEEKQAEEPAPTTEELLTEILAELKKDRK